MEKAVCVILNKSLKIGLLNFVDEAKNLFVKAGKILGG